MRIAIFTKLNLSPAGHVDISANKLSKASHMPVLEARGRGQETFNDEFALCCCSWQQTVRSLGTVAGGSSAKRGMGGGEEKKKE